MALCAAVAIGAVVTAVQASVPDSSGQIHGCYSANGAKATNGTTLYILDSASASCAKGQTEVKWNQTGSSVTSSPLSVGSANCPTGGSSFTTLSGTTFACNGAKGDKGDPGTNGTNGTNGANGVSVTSTSLSTGDANCPAGGSSFTSASGTTYACNGARGDKGDPGTNGTNGTSVTSSSLSPGDANCPTGGSSFTSASGTTYACNGATGGAGSGGSTLYLARGVLDCPGSAATCLAPEFSPSGNTNPENGGDLDFLNLPTPPGGMTATKLTINLVGAGIIPSGGTMVFNLVQGGSTNVFLHCEIDSPATSCDSGTTSVSIPGNTDLVIEIDTSFQFNGSPNHFADITWQGSAN
jgi:hypothetical protein